MKRGIEVGTNRVAIVGENATIKVAKVHALQFGKQVAETVQRHGLRSAFDSWRHLGPDVHQSLRNRLLGGVSANRRESRLARDHGDAVVPTISILGGLVNIQRTAEYTDVTFAEMQGSFADNLGSDVVRLGHMMEHGQNIGVLSGTVKFLDGGSPALEALLELRPAEMAASLDSVTEKHFHAADRPLSIA